MPKLGYYEIGNYNSQCDECGRWFKFSSMRKRWDGAWVCDTGTCWEPRQPQDFQRGVKDDPSVPIARPRIGITGPSYIVLESPPNELVPGYLLMEGSIGYFYILLES